MKLNSRALLLGAFLFFAIAMDSVAQESERPLLYSVEQMQRADMERQWPERAARGGGSLSIPFFDDFSTFSLPTNDPDIPQALQRWEDNFARINATIPLSPPTYGVATLDGLDADGFPYQFVENSYGEADVLTSLPINLQGLTIDNNVYLHFRYQGGGRGNSPEDQDSLVVDFLAPGGGDDAWFRQWSVEGAETEGFISVFIPIEDPLFLTDGFKFRFRNYATLAGNLDHWNLDFVFLDSNIDPSNFDVVEVAFVEPVNGLLNEFTAMPWSHFTPNPASFMEDQVASISRNLSASQADNIQSGFKVESVETGAIQDFENDFQTVIVNPFEVFEVPYFVNDDPNNFVYDTSVNDTCALFNVTFYQDEVGLFSDDKVGVLDNDSIQFTQVFQNYYAYDDGSAESAYSLQNQAGGRVAMRYNVAEPDTLLGLFIHFTPFQFDNSNETFLLRVWDNDGGVPGNELGENFSFKTPNYFTDGYDVFAYYEYDDPQLVNGSIFVGLVQNNAVEMNFGLDKNTNQNPSKLFFQLGLGASWQQSNIQGTVMIRPVFAAGKSDVWNSVEELNAEAVSIYPNPANNHVTVAFETPGIRELRVLNQTGQVVHAETLRDSKTTISTQQLATGLYIIEILQLNGTVSRQKLLVK
ncbi:MAG: T9SS type A sorting domain-containing protein [Flavobacteriales bacterium]|nr:T9SS type A sorting domain-containing protein [Flavobacteriales bacterium]